MFGAHYEEHRVIIRMSVQPVSEYKFTKSKHFILSLLILVVMTMCQGPRISVP
jgi:hypothetical protein